MEKGLGKKIIDIDYNSPDYDTIKNLTENIYQFSGAKNQQQLKEINSLLNTKDGKIKPWNEFKKDALKIHSKYNKHYLKTEYNHSIAVSQNIARYNEMPKGAMMEYMTAGDKNVRTEHQLLNGIKKRKDDKFWDVYMPPNGWGCRCEAIETNDKVSTPLNEEALNKLSKTVPQMFRTNPAKTGQIFPKGHPFFKGAPKKVETQYYLRVPTEFGFIKETKKIRTHKLHRLEDDYSSNIRCAKVIEKKCDKIELLPQVNKKDYRQEYKDYLKAKGIKDFKKFDKGKNPDFLIEKKGEVFFMDAKKVTGKNSISNGIKKAHRQADYVVFDITNKHSIHKVESEIIRKYKSYYLNKEEINLKGIWLRKGKEVEILDIDKIKESIKKSKGK